MGPLILGKAKSPSATEKEEFRDNKTCRSRGILKRTKRVFENVTPGRAQMVLTNCVRRRV